MTWSFTGKIAWAHLKEIRDYYTRLDRLEAEAQAETIGIWPLVGGSPDHAGPAAPDKARPDGLAPAFSGVYSGLLPRLRHNAGDPDDDIRCGRAHARDSSGGDLFALLIEG